MFFELFFIFFTTFHLLFHKRASSYQLYVTFILKEPQRLLIRAAFLSFNNMQTPKFKVQLTDAF